MYDPVRRYALDRAQIPRLHRGLFRAASRRLRLVERDLLDFVRQTWEARCVPAYWKRGEGLLRVGALGVMDDTFRRNARLRYHRAICIPARTLQHRKGGDDGINRWGSGRSSRVRTRRRRVGRRRWCGRGSGRREALHRTSVHNRGPVAPGVVHDALGLDASALRSVHEREAAGACAVMDDPRMRAPRGEERRRARRRHPSPHARPPVVDELVCEPDRPVAHGPRLGDQSWTMRCCRGERPCSPWMLRRSS